MLIMKNIRQKGEDFHSKQHQNDPDKNQKQTAKFQTQICLQRIYNLFKYGKRKKENISVFTNKK